MDEKIKVLIIDDHPLMRRGIKQLIELEQDFIVVGDAGNGNEGLSLALKTGPDLIVLDLNMKGLSGLDTLKALRNEGIDARIVILTVSDAKNDIFLWPSTVLWHQQRAPFGRPYQRSARWRKSSYQQVWQITASGSMTRSALLRQSESSYP